MPPPLLREEPHRGVHGAGVDASRVRELLGVGESVAPDGHSPAMFSTSAARTAFAPTWMRRATGCAIGGPAYWSRESHVAPAGVRQPSCGAHETVAPEPAVAGRVSAYASRGGS